MKTETLAELEKLFLALSDKTRLNVLGLMAGGPVSVGFLADTLGSSQPKISRHLAYLRSSGLVSTRRDGKWIYYAIEMPKSGDARHILLETLAALDFAGARQDTPQPERQDEPVFETQRATDELEIHLL